MKKILVLCDHGQTRSVAMASVLRDAGHFAVAGSYDAWDKLEEFEENLYSNRHVQNMNHLSRPSWSKIIFMQEGGEHFIGRDVWSDCTHPELLEKCREKARELGLL